MGGWEKREEAVKLTPSCSLVVCTESWTEVTQQGHSQPDPRAEQVDSRESLEVALSTASDLSLPVQGEESRASYRNKIYWLKDQKNMLGMGESPRRARSEPQAELGVAPNIILIAIIIVACCWYFAGPGIGPGASLTQGQVLC